MIDLTGQKLGMITVLSKSDVTSAKKLVRWNCVCDCGRTFVSTGSGLIRRKHQNCGHASHQNIAGQYPGAVKPGDKFGSLIVIHYQQSDKNYNSMWLCQCECGNQTLVRTQALKSGRTKSCGCQKPKPPKKDGLGRVITVDLTGKKFGHLTALHIDSSKKQGAKYWICQCDCGVTKTVNSSDLKNGYVKSCGCKRFDLWKQSSPTYKGGRHLANGYIVLTGYLEHPNAIKGRIFEHTLVMSNIIDRPLMDNENVHHKNGIRNDNRPENLELWVKRQPQGQRVEDRIADAVSLLKLYAPHLLANDVAISEFFVTKETDEVPS